MELLKEIILSTLYNNKAKVSIDFGDTDIPSILDVESSKRLKEIHRVLCDDTLDDFQCIENIITIYENIGITCGSRHNF